MKINVLSYALTVEECGSFNKASSKLYISQPNLSLAIQSLEKELGYPVFNRTNQGVQLTEKGKEFIIFAKNILNNYEKMMTVRDRFEKLQYHIVTAASSILEEPFYTLCMLLLSQNIKIERCILILGINIEPDDLADLRKSINRLDVYCAASSG